ncbi:zinc-ribbon-domain-containing protein [Trichophaea hybrida]|nr:zinc-ribbon-domain-containing protein [Trichophaea hybrida]
MPPPEGHLNAAVATASIITTSQRAIPIKSSALPEDDGQSQLRQKLSDITRSNLPERERAKKMHQIMTEKWNASRASKAALLADLSTIPTAPTFNETTVDPDPSDKTNPYKLQPGDSEKTYYTGPGSNPDSEFVELGCSHYRRGVRLQCSTCERWHTCRFCHDENEDHALVRRETKSMLCMHCGRPQPAQQDCRFCGVRSAKYYCDKCKLWDDGPQKSIYHCNDCGICRIGQGLGKDFFHCKKCGVCMSIALENSHRCIERSTECDCPICGEFMFTSTLTVVFMTCGHSIHHKCYYEHMKNSYRCPTCARTIINMESQFRSLDVEIESQPLPSPYAAWRCLISCNDCSAKSNVRFHFLGLKCDNCASYNTSQVRIIRPEDGNSAEVLPSDPQPISPTGLERMRSLPVMPVLAVNSPPRAASTEHGNAVDTEDAGFGGRALAGGIQVAGGPSEDRIVDDGWESDNSDDFLDEDEIEEQVGEEEEDESLEESSCEEDDDDDDDDEELFNLRGHI